MKKLGKTNTTKAMIFNIFNSFVSCVRESSQKLTLSLIFNESSMKSLNFSMQHFIGRFYIMSAWYRQTCDICTYILRSALELIFGVVLLASNKSLVVI